MLPVSKLAHFFEVCPAFVSLEEEIPCFSYTTSGLAKCESRTGTAQRPGGHLLISLLPGPSVPAARPPHVQLGSLHRLPELLRIQPDMVETSTVSRATNESHISLALGDRLLSL